MPGEILRAMIPTLSPRPSLVPADLALLPADLAPIIHHLCAIMPINDNEEINSLLWKVFEGGRGATMEFLKLAVYMLSNKVFPMVIYDTDHRESRAPRALFCDELFKWFQMGQNHLFLREILSCKTPTIEAFAECIFASALHFEDKEFLGIFFQYGISLGILVEIRTGQCKSPLHFAAKNDSVGSGIPVKIRSYGYESPLDFAVKRGNVSLAKMLVEMGADVQSNTPLGTASRHGYFELVKLLVDYGVVVDTGDYCQPLLEAAARQHLDIVSLLLENGADVNLHCPLERAVRKKATGVVELLLERDADVNCEPGKDTPLQSAAMVNDRDLVKRLLHLGADANAPASFSGKTALQWAAENENLEICQALLEAGADVNAAPSDAKRPESLTALTSAVKAKNYELVALLLEHKADVNDRRGYLTALEEVTDVQMLQVLLSAGADLNQDLSFVNAIEAQDHDLVQALL